MMCCKPIAEQFVIFARKKCHEFPPLKGVESQDKSVHVFLISNSGFYLSFRLLREDLNFRLKVTKKLLTEVASQPRLT